jgi:ABC-type phosphate transport system substrate-binding protein
MKRRSLLLLPATCFLTALDCMVPLLRVASAADEVDVIVNKSNTITDLTLGDAQKLFKGEKTTWPNGKRVTILMLASGQPERAVVLHDIYKMSDSEYSKFFLEATFSGTVTAPPKEASSAAQIKQMIADNPGGIGYVKKSDVDDSVKVVLKVP